MAFVTTKDGKVRPAQVSDLKEVAERDERIKQLEQQCAVLAAEIDRMRPVVEAACALIKLRPQGSVIRLSNAIDTYEANAPK